MSMSIHFDSMQLQLLRAARDGLAKHIVELIDDGVDLEFTESYSVTIITRI